jgi:hypothetical protein
MWKINRT